MADDETSPEQAEGASEGEHEEVVPVDEAHDVEEQPVPQLTEEDFAILDFAQRDLINELREDALRTRAEFVNFRNRVERDRQSNREAAITEVLRSLLPALDDLDRAEVHGDIGEGTPMGIIAMKLRTSLARFGLTQFGAIGDPFDPAMHEALFQKPTPGAESETVLDIVEYGYRFGDRVVRPAKVVVSVPAPE